uniref:Uncharacterized protein n=1 Tax=Arundo donax TaxID=35708 RepID=A0A0A8YB73_ARUDO
MWPLCSNKIGVLTTVIRTLSWR